MVLSAVLACGTGLAADKDWPVYLGDKARSHYSSLNQIHAGNVSKLQVAWAYHAGDARDDNQSQIQCNPLIIGGVLYGTTAQLKLVALEATSGHELWRYDPFAGSAKGGVVGVNRGVVYWKDGTDRRILYSADHFLYAIDAATGRPVRSFGTEGHVDLKADLGRDVSGLYVVETTPGTVFKNLIFLPLRVGEGPAPGRTGTHPRLRHPHGEDGLDIPYDSLAGRVWVRHVAAGRLDPYRRGQLLGGHGPG